MFLSKLAGALAELYPDPLDVRRLAADADLPVGRIDFTGPALQVWFATLEEGQKQGRLTDMLDIAMSEYPGNAMLYDAAWTYVRDLKSFGRIESENDVATDRELERTIYELSAEMKSIGRRLDRLERHELPSGSGVPNGNAKLIVIMLTVIAVGLFVGLYLLANGGMT